MGLHPALVAEQHTNFFKTSHPFLASASFLSFIGEMAAFLCFIVLTFTSRYDGLIYLLIAIGTLIPIAFTMLSLYYIVFCHINDKKAIIPKIRIAVFVSGGIFIAGLASGGFFLGFALALGSYRSPTYQLITLIIFFFYFSVIGFMIVIQRDHKRLINEQLQNMNG